MYNHKLRKISGVIVLVGLSLLLGYALYYHDDIAKLLQVMGVLFICVLFAYFSSSFKQRHDNREHRAKFGKDWQEDD